MAESVRREADRIHTAGVFGHVIVFGERHLRRTLTAYFTYYMRSRTHLALGKDAPTSRPVTPPSAGRIVATPQVGGLHHRYDRAAA
jgi:putative transposase